MDFIPEETAHRLAPLILVNVFENFDTVSGDTRLSCFGPHSGSSSEYSVFFFDISGDETVASLVFRCKRDGDTWFLG
jgi:hypothetical protein